MSSPFQQSFSAKSPLNQSRPANINEPRKKTVIKKQTSLNQVEINQDEADSFSFVPSKLGGIQAVADNNRKAAKRKMSQPTAKSPTNYGSPLEQEVDSKKKQYQDSIQKLHKPAYDEYLKRKTEGYSSLQDIGAMSTTYTPPETDPTKVKSLKDFAYAKEVGKGGTVKDSEGRTAYSLAKKYR